MEEEISSKNKELLRQIFCLKYHNQEKQTNSLALARQLKLDPVACVQLEVQLEALLHRKLGVVDDETLQCFCPECLDTTITQDNETGEYACIRCGFVPNLPSQNNIADQDQSLPMDSTFAPKSEMGIDKSLGGTLRLDVPSTATKASNETLGIIQVLSKANGKKDLPIRVMLLQNMIHTENSTLAALLKEAFWLSGQYGLDSNKVFNNDLGRYLRRAFYVLHEELALKVNSQELLHTVFWFALYQHGKTTIADEVKKQGTLKINPVLLGMIVKHNYFLLQLEKEKEASAINPDDFMAKTEKLYKIQVIGEQLFKNNPHFL